MQYKLLCSDMDGTLLTDDKEISTKSKQTIKKAIEKGVNICVCTGRIFLAAAHFADVLETDAPVIAANGAYIRGKDENEVLYKCTLNKDKCMEILKLLKEYNIHPTFYTPTSIITNALEYSAKYYKELNKSLPENRKINIEIIDGWNMEEWENIFKKNEGEIVKSIAIDDDIEKIKNVRVEFQRIKGINVESSSPNNFEMMDEMVSKGRAVKMLAAFYGIPKEEVICIGDNENDISMIEYAGLGIAMGNAENMVKEKANYITDTNNNHGVAKAIQKFILTK